MDEKKNPHIPPWRVWIIVLLVIQIISTARNNQVHQQLWNSLNEHTESTSQYLAERMLLDFEIQEKIVELREKLFHFLEVN